MYIEGGSYLGNRIRAVWHCEQMRSVCCAWLDTDTARYGELSSDYRSVDEKQAKKIVFDPQALMIYINPLDDDADTKEVHGEETISA